MTTQAPRPAQLGKESGKSVVQLQIVADNTLAMHQMAHPIHYLRLALNQLQVLV